MTNTHDLSDELGVSLDDLMDAAVDLQNAAMREGRGHRAVFTSWVLDDDFADLSDRAAADLRAHFAAPHPA